MHNQLLCCLSLLAWSVVAAEQQVSVFNTYLEPPFIMQTDPNGIQGVAPELVRFLNQKLQGSYHLVLRNVPRERLSRIELTQEANFTGMAILLAPAFVNDSLMNRFLWTRPLFEDHNVLVFRGPTAPDVSSLKDLHRMTFAKVRGYHYAQLDDMIARGELKMELNNNQFNNLKMVLLGRVNFTQLNSSNYQYLSELPQFKGQLVAIPQPEDPPFQRRILVGKANPELYRRVEQALQELPCDPNWQTLGHHLGFQAGACLQPADE